MFSPDGDQGFPGNAHIQITCTLNVQGLEINNDMCRDQDPVFNMTNHIYFNLARHQHTERAMSYTLWLNAQTYTPVDPFGIPTGDLEYSAFLEPGVRRMRATVLFPGSQ